jgi:hypothetical protein
MKNSQFFIYLNYVRFVQLAFTLSIYSSELFGYFFRLLFGNKLTSHISKRSFLQLLLTSKLVNIFQSSFVNVIIMGVSFALIDNPRMLESLLSRWTTLVIPIQKCNHKFFGFRGNFIPTWSHHDNAT